MFINPKVKDLIPVNNLEDVYVVADFDRTITVYDSKSSWDILGESKYAPSSYIKERQELFDYYYPIECAAGFDDEYKILKQIEWFEKHINLFVKYKLKEDIFADAAQNTKLMKPRFYAIEFIEYLHKNNIPLIIFSAGVGNFIEKFLENYNCYYDNIYIVSNMIKCKKGIAVGIENDIIHTFNKNESSIPKNITDKLKDRNTVILIGDHIGDTTMVDSSKHKSVIKVGFASQEIPEEVLSNYYDIVLDKKENYKDILISIFNDL